MPKRHRILKGSTVLLVAVATGCATPTPSATGPGAASDLAPKAGGNLISNNAGGLISNNAGGLISNNAGGLISNNAGGLISNNAGGLISNNAGGLISNNAGGLISNNAGGLISNNAGGLTGAVRGPAAGLISNNAGGLISNNAGGLISNNAGGLISNNAGGLISNNAGGLISNNAGGLISNNAGGLISNNAGGYHLVQADEQGAGEELVDLTSAVPNARVGVFNERGEMISYSWVTTDEDGNYTFPRLKPSGPMLFVKAIYEKEGQQVILMSTAPAPRKAGLVNVAVNPATTLIAKKFGEMIRLRAISASTIRPSLANKMASVLAPAMTARSVVAAAIFTNDVAADTFDNVMDEAPANFSGFLTELAKVAGAPAVVAETPTAELTVPPPAPTAALPPEEIPNVDSGVGAVGGETGGTAAPVADGGTAAPGTDGGATGGTSAPVSDGGATGGTTTGGDAGGATGGATGGTSGGGAAPAAEPVQSATKATVKTLGKSIGVDRLEVQPGTGAIFVPSESGLQTATAANATDAITFSAASGNATAVCFDGATKYTLYGATITWSGGEVSAEGIDSSQTVDLAVKDGFGYISSLGQNCVFKVDLSNGTTTAFAGTPTYYGGYAEGTGTAAQFNQPGGIAVTEDGFYVCDTLNRRIRKIGFDGTTSTLAGARYGNKDGLGGAAQFQSPTDITVDTEGNLYVTDSASQTVRRIAADGLVTTIAGSRKIGSVDGTGDTVSFYFPSSLSFTKIGGVDSIIVAQGDGKVRIVTGW